MQLDCVCSAVCLDRIKTQLLLSFLVSILTIDFRHSFSILSACLHFFFAMLILPLSCHLSVSLSHSSLSSPLLLSA